MIRSLPLLLSVSAALLSGSSGALAAQDYSAAEQALFMSNQLAALRPPTTLRYKFVRAGSLEENFEDQVAVGLSAQPDGSCCVAKPEFFSGTRRYELPTVDVSEGNPSILYFLERDIREMQRLTKGQSNYFRKRIRMAIYQGATLKEIRVPWAGKEVAARQITIAPYLDDPLRARFEKYANKQYVFTLSDAVPGGVYAIRTRIAAPAGAAAPLLDEEMLLDGAASTSPKP